MKKKSKFSQKKVNDFLDRVGRQDFLDIPMLLAKTEKMIKPKIRKFEPVLIIILAVLIALIIVFI